MASASESPTLTHALRRVLDVVDESRKALAQILASFALVLGQLGGFDIQALSPEMVSEKLSPRLDPTILSNPTIRKVTSTQDDAGGPLKQRAIARAAGD
jgi:hypothetical protein